MYVVVLHHMCKPAPCAKWNFPFYPTQPMLTSHHHHNDVAVLCCMSHIHPHCKDVIMLHQMSKPATPCEVEVPCPSDAAQTPHPHHNVVTHFIVLHHMCKPAPLCKMELPFLSDAPQTPHPTHHDAAQTPQPPIPAQTPHIHDNVVTDFIVLHHMCKPAPSRRSPEPPPPHHNVVAQRTRMFTRHPSLRRRTA